jgi:hypothetical protein
MMKGAKMTNWQLFTIEDKLRGGKKKTLVNLDQLTAIEQCGTGARLFAPGLGDEGQGHLFVHESFAPVMRMAKPANTDVKS